MSANYTKSVFINCPFTQYYDELFRAITFTVIDCGFIPRCAREDIDSGDIRLQKIQNIIEACKFGVHDLSNMDLDPNSGLPRFNMPLELGLFLGAKRFGEGRQSDKRLIIFDREAYRYQQAISDISGQDVESHEADLERLIARLRNWLRTASRRTTIPGAAQVVQRYRAFETDLPAICQALNYDPNDLPFIDFCEAIVEWQKLDAGP